MNTWNKVMKLKVNDNRSRGVANTLDNDDLDTILATADFFGASATDLQQISFDLRIAKYRVFDWLAMAIQGRVESESARKVFAHAFIKVDGDVTAFINDLRVSDYQIDTAWENVKLTY